VEGKSEFSSEECKALYYKAHEIVSANMPIIREKLPTEEVIAEFERRGFDDKVDLLQTRQHLYSSIHRLGDEVGSMLLTGVPSKVSGNWRKSVIHAGRNFTLLAVSLVAAGEIAMLNVNLLPEEPEVRIGIVVAILVSLPLAYRYLWPAVSAAGAEFRSALETESRISEQPASKVFTLPGDHYGRYRLAPESPAVGLTIKALDIRAKTGASIVAVVREGVRNRNPGADWCFAPGDEAEAIGSPKELAALKDLLGVISPA
jgi:hypothetical protein